MTETAHISFTRAIQGAATASLYPPVWGRGRRIVSAACVLAGLFLMCACAYEPVKAPQLNILVESDPQGRATDVPEVGDSISVSIQGVEPGERLEIFLNDDLGREWSYARVYADTKGRVEPFVFWYHGGVIGTTSLPIEFKPDPAFRTFEEAEAFFAEHPLRFRVTGADGQLLAEQEWQLRPRQSAMVYPSNAEGVLMNGIHAVDEDVFVSGRNFPPGATVHLALVENRYDWHVGDPIEDITGPNLSAQSKTVQLAPGETRFTLPLWSRERSRPGAYDIVARIGKAFDQAQLLPDDILSFNGDTGVVLYMIINGNIVIDVAGRMKGAPAKFEFSDSFEKGQDVYGAVDPSDVPAMHTGGNYAAYYVVNDQDEAYWDGVSPAIGDVSGGFEIQRVKYWCINASRRKIWDNATQIEPIKAYDIVVDFGSTPAMTSGDFNPDGIYNKGTDFIDGYQDAGFYVFEDPASVGPFPVGTAELDEPNGISGMPFDPMGMTGPDYVVDLAWGYIMYPAQAAGSLQPVSNTQPNYRVAVFLHGRHRNCDSNGAAAGGSATYEWPGGCADANRIPNHRGYDYILQRLASQGIIAVSIDAFEIQKDNSDWNYDLRGRLVLKWLDKLRDWNDNGTDPFGGIFQGKIDMSRVALSGHSRGGEGVVAAQHLNQTWPNPHDIVAVNAIAPTDQNWLPLNGGSFYYQMTDAPYHVILGSRDGDIWDFHGMRTYDRAYPEGMPNRKHKAVSFVYGANHNFFNTIWTPTADLGWPNPWAGAVDEGESAPFEMSAAGQRAIARTTIAAFFRRHLQDLEPYKEIFTGRLQPAAIDNAHVYWTYQDAARLALDDFEQLPQNPNQNSQLGPVTNGGFSSFEEKLFNYYRSSYNPEPPSESWTYHDTLGIKLGWGANATYTTEFPGGLDASGFSHLSLRAGKVIPNSNSETPGPDLNLRINVEDGAMNSATWDLHTDQFDPIPHPFFRGYYQMVMTGVRIPLRQFTMNNSGVVLSDLRTITIQTEGSDELILDDIELGN